MAESALRQYEYGGEGLFGAFMPSRREIISPKAQIPMGYRQGRRGPEVVLENIPAKYGEPESGFEYAPVVRGIKSALNYIGDAFSDPQQAIESVQTVAPQALAGVDQYMRDQYTAGALGGTTYNPQTGQVTEFDPTVAMVGGAPAGVLAVRAATPGSVVLGMVGSKNTKYTPEQREAIKQLDARGWDTEKLFLHGTASDYDDAFRASQTGDLGPGFYTTGQVFDDAGEISTVMSRSGKMETVPDIAERYANIRKFMRPEQRGSGAPNTRPVVYKKDLNFLDVQGGMVGPVDAERVNALKAQGYDGIRVIDPNTGNVAQTNVFDPDNVRSAFDYSIPDTPAQGQSALRNLTNAPAPASNDLDAGGSSQILASGSKRGTGVAAASALTGDYRDRIIQEYPKSYNPIIIDNYVNQGVDPRTFTAGSGKKTSDPRVGQMSILGGTNINIGDPRMGQVKEIDLGDYEGYPFFTSMSDRAAAGDVILDINGVPINVSRRGGQNYMFDPESGEFVWASDKGVVLKSKGEKLSDTSFFKTAQDLKKTYGKDPLIIPWTMAPTGIDFSTQIGETMLSYAKNAMSRADLRSLDKDVKNIIPEWKGIDSPDWTVSFRNTTGNQRKAVSDLLDKKYVDKGGITSGIARYANTDVDLRMARDGQVMNVGMVDTDRYPMTDNRIVHPTYDTGLYGEGVGRIGGDVQVFELLPTARQLMGISDPLNPARSALRALEMKPYSGIITESTLRAIEDRRR